MSSIMKLLRRIGGTKSTPTSGDEGQLAVWKADKTPTGAISVFFHDGAQWVELLDTAMTALRNVVNTFSASQVIDVTDNANPALRITQKGTGDALLVEDDAHPDATPFVVKGNGNVGIGTLTPGTNLDVAGTIHSSGTDASVKAVATTGAAGLSVISNARNWRWVTTNGDQAIRLNDETLALERIRVDEKGNLGIGIVPVDKFHVAGNIRASGIDAGIAAMAKGGSAYVAMAGSYRYWRWITSDADQSMRLSDDTSGYVRFAVATNGALTALGVYGVTGAGSNVVVDSTGNIMRTSSSLKYKKNVEPLDHAIVDNAVRNLKPVWYRHKKVSGDDKAEWSHIGLIAEDVAKVEKRLVNFKTAEVTFEKKTVTREDGTTDEVTEQVVTPLAEPIPEDVDYARLSVILLDYVQRLEKRVAALEART